MKKNVIVDMDGVLVDIYTRFFELHKQESGGETIMFTQPHNTLTDSKHRRVGSWADIEKQLLT